MTVIYFILAALALGILVFIHELGHYWQHSLLCRKQGIKNKEPPISLSSSGIIFNIKNNP